VRTCEEILPFNKFFPLVDTPTKLRDGAPMANFGRFLRLFFQPAACSTFQTCVLNSHQGHTVCGSMVDIQSATAEIRPGKKEDIKKEETTDKNIMSASATQGGHN